MGKEKSKIIKMRATLLTPQPEIVYEGIGWSKGTTIELYKPGAHDCGSSKLKIIDRKKITEVEFRNVGQINQEAMIQFTIEERNRESGRTKLVSFSVPAVMADAFITMLSTPWK
jgi:hypothetical protein